MGIGNRTLGSNKKGGSKNYNRSQGDTRFLKPVRVIDIILDINWKSEDGKVSANDYGGYDAIGTIFYADTFEPKPQAVAFQSRPARPLYSFIKNYPLKNELVLLVDAPTKDFYLDRGAGTQYYMPVINIWNHSHNNALPEMPYHIKDGKEEIKETYIGKNIIRNPDTDDGVDVPLGEYFNENLNLQPLLPFEGDLLVEGRFGNSIRLGATAKEAREKTAYSAKGETGDPITIIRNGQHIEESDNGWEHTIENINSDHSTIYLTSNQCLPNMEIVSTHWQSWMAKHDELDVGQAIDDFDNLNAGPTAEEVVTPLKPSDDKEMDETPNEDIEADEDKNEEPEGCEDCDDDNPEGEKSTEDHIDWYRQKTGQDKTGSPPESNPTDSTDPEAGDVDTSPPPQTQENSTPTLDAGEEYFREGNCPAGVPWRDHNDYTPGVTATASTPQTLDGWSWTRHEGAYNYKGFNITFSHAKDGANHITTYDCEPAPGEKYEERSKKAYVYENAGGGQTLSQVEEYIQNEINDFDEDGYVGWDE